MNRIPGEMIFVTGCELNHSESLGLAQPMQQGRKHMAEGIQGKSHVSFDISWAR